MRLRRVSIALQSVVLWLLTLTVVVPFYMVVVNSLKNLPEASAVNLQLPSVFEFANYREAFVQSKLLGSFFNSLYTTTMVVAITMTLSAMAAFVLARVNSRRNSFIFNVFLIGLIAPMNMVTTFQVLKKFDLINTYTGVILLYCATFLPFSIFLYLNFIKGIPRELDDAGMVDGVQGFGLFFKIIFPLLTPVTVTVLIINFMNCWNDFTIPLYFLTTSDKWGMIIHLYGYMGTFFSQKNLMFAVMVMTMLPIVLIYLLGQKYIISGMVSGSLKG